MFQVRTFDKKSGRMGDKKMSPTDLIDLLQPKMTTVVKQTRWACTVFFNNN